MLQIAAMFYSLFWGAVIGLLGAPPFLWPLVGALLAAISVWQDRRRIMRPAKRLKEETQSLRWLHPVMAPLAFLEIYVVAGIMATGTGWNSILGAPLASSFAAPFFKLRHYLDAIPVGFPTDAC
jgi:hypothetical protein